MFHLDPNSSDDRVIYLHYNTTTQQHINNEAVQIYINARLDYRLYGYAVEQP